MSIQNLSALKLSNPTLCITKINERYAVVLLEFKSSDPFNRTYTVSRTAEGVVADHRLNDLRKLAASLNPNKLAISATGRLVP